MLLTLSVDAVAITWGEPTWQYFIHVWTHMFGHANWPHLLGNYMFLFPYGLFLEHAKGPRRFVSCWLISGLGSLLTHQIMTGSSYGGLIGASGAISGIMAAALLSLNKNPLYLLAGVSVLSFRFYLEVLRGLTGLGSIAYWGHAGGMLFGALCALLWFFQDGGLEKIRRSREQLNRLLRYGLLRAQRSMRRHKK